MIEEKKNNYILLKIVLYLFVIFFIMYVTKGTVYFEHQNYIRKELTKESILQFEKDIKDGKDVTINEYKQDDYIDYSNFMSKTGTKINSIVESFMNDGIKKTLKVLSQLFYE